MEFRTSMWNASANLCAQLALTASLVLAPIVANAQHGQPLDPRAAQWLKMHQIPAQSSAARAPMAGPDWSSDSIRYDVRSIGPLPGATDSYAAHVNNCKHVAGYSWVASSSNPNSIDETSQAFIWKHGEFELLPSLKDWQGTFANSINDFDVVVGYTTKVDSAGNISETAVKWVDGKPINLGTVLPGYSAFPYDVNDWGVAVGGVYDSTGTMELPVAWYGGTSHLLPLLPGMHQGIAEAISDLGIIAGSQIQLPENDVGVIPVLWFWDGEKYAAVQLTGLSSPSEGDAAYGINDYAQSVGFSGYTNAAEMYIEGAVRWDLFDIHNLGFLPGEPDAAGESINNRGQVVGFSADFEVFPFTVKDFLWEKGKMTDLQTLVPSGTPPFGFGVGNINDRGDIAISGIEPGGNSIALLLTPKN